MIDKKSYTPLYIQLAEELRRKIFSGEIKVNDKLPSETEMIETYKLGRLTVRSALSILVNEGLVEKRHGMGTFCISNCSSKSQRIDIMLDLSDIYFTPYFLRSICSVFETANVNTLLSETHNDENAICSSIERALSEGTDGIIFQPPNYTDTASDRLIKLIELLIEKNIPYIMIDTCYQNLPPSYVIMNDVQAGKIAADYFVRMGHKRLCVIKEDLRIDSRMRLKGFTSVLPEAVLIENDTELKSNIATMLQACPDITGIFCFHEGIAKKCYEILDELNVSIPEDISVISVDDTVIASTLTPALTSVVHPKEFMGETVAKAMLDILSGRLQWPYVKIYEPSIAIRKSCINII